ncbi:MAG TPA: RluA family pseudouridine synthase [Methylibium sp.]|uniref:RluA family pseudouridine synthase n=1 Tax=Methylibium sp. TaxID=2067992 RepID=UPI002DBE9378|nr:RluA family pseudouridine synthase [Methylibium sp.]HEU4457742.1 RluA family pseudouridine synthase [Methylibium sp.]
MAGAVGALEVVHCDDALIVVAKPAGLLSVPGRGADKQDCAAARVQRRWPDALVVHRLDEATSGLLLFARGLEAQRRLSRAFETGMVDKRYVAVVQGRVDAEAGRIELPLAADWPRRPRQRVAHDDGKPAATDWQMIERGAATTRLALQPRTGRTHQLRVHLAAIGHPILGDALYGDAGSATRLLLHACELSFVHPRDATRSRFESPPPF